MEIFILLFAIVAFYLIQKNSIVVPPGYALILHNRFTGNHLYEQGKHVFFAPFLVWPLRHPSNGSVMFIPLSPTKRKGTLTNAKTQSRHISLDIQYSYWFRVESFEKSQQFLIPDGKTPLHSWNILDDSIEKQISQAVGKLSGGDTQNLIQNINQWVTLSFKSVISSPGIDISNFQVVRLDEKISHFPLSVNEQQEDN